jgi:serine/threonine protein kinase
MSLPPEFETCAQKIVAFLNERGLKIDKQIGGGAQGVAFALVDSKTGKISSVLKTTTPGNPGITPFDPDQGSHLVANLKHPNLCIPTEFFYVTPFKDLSFVPIPGSTCIATIMPYIQSHSLGDDPQSIFDFGLQLAAALQVLAKNGLAHRDLARNIMVDEQGRPNIIDFDWCKRKKDPEKDVVSDQEYLRLILKARIQISKENFEPSAAKFLQSCLDIATEEQLLSLTFMQNCLDHLEEIQKKPISKL